jgi:hypothetical protein
MKYLLVIILVSLLTTCTAPTPSSSPVLLVTSTQNLTTSTTFMVPQTPFPAPIIDLAPYFADTTLKQIEVKIQDSMLGTAGTLINANLRNDFGEYRTFSLTCGYTFTPKVNNDLQQMILIQPLEFSMESLGWLNVFPITVCIEPDKDVPVNGELYNFGPMAEGDLKKLADCACGSTISPEDTIALFTQQLAFWMVALGKDSGKIISMTPEEFIELLASKEVDQETIDSLRDFLPLVKLRTITVLKQCGF